MPVLKKFGNLVLPSGFHRAARGQGSVHELATKIRPKGVSEKEIATIARATGSLLDPTTGIPVIAGRTGSGLGTPAPLVTAVEYGTEHQRLTVLTFSGVSFSPNVPANDEAVGALVYTLPAGPFIAYGSYLDITFTKGANTNDVDFGVGSSSASGDVTVLGGTADFEDWHNGNTISDPDLFRTAASLGGSGTKLFQTADSHSVYVNMAGAFTAAVTPATVSGTLALRWDKLS